VKVRENGCEWNAWTCALAARWGHFDILQWCRKNGCQWSAETTAAAARGGHCNIRTWCIESDYLDGVLTKVDIHRMPWHQGEFASAIMNRF
jgi:hypothetical protein